MRSTTWLYAVSELLPHNYNASVSRIAASITASKQNRIATSRIRDNSVENIFGVYNGDVFLQPLSNFRMQYVCEVRAAAESGFVCRITLFNGDDQGYVRFTIDI